MGFSEAVVLLLIYSGLLLFFLVPFSKQKQSKNHRGKISFSSVLKENLVKMIFHKKAMFAFVLFGLALISIQASFEGAEWHYNVHSGYSPISYKLPAFYTMGSLFIYTVILLILLGYMRTLKTMKCEK